MDDTTGAGARPLQATVAFGLVLVAAACVLAFTAMIPLQIGPTLADSRQAAAAAHLSLAALQHELVVVSVVLVAAGVVVAGLLVLFAMRFRTGRPRARIAVVLLTLLLVLSLNLPLMLTAVVLAVADVLMFLRPVAAWLRAAEAERAVARR